MTGKHAKPPADFERRLTALEAAVAAINSVIGRNSSAAEIASPVAMPILKEAAQHEFASKFFSLLDVGESLLKYSAAIAFASAIRNAGPTHDYVMDLFERPPSLGKLAEGLRTVLDDRTNADWPVDMVRRAFRRPNNKPTSTARYLAEEFISVRNAARGHGSSQPQGYYESLYRRHTLNVMDSVRACEHLTSPLLHIHTVDHDRDQYSYTATLLMGAAPVRVSEPIVATARVRSGSTCLWDGGRRLITLDDFVVYRYCDQCSLEHIFFAEQITDHSVAFHSYVGNHRFTAQRGSH